MSRLDREFLKYKTVDHFFDENNNILTQNKSILRVFTFDVENFAPHIKNYASFYKYYVILI